MLKEDARADLQSRTQSGDGGKGDGPCGVPSKFSDGGAGEAAEAGRRFDSQAAVGDEFVEVTDDDALGGKASASLGGKVSADHYRG